MEVRTEKLALRLAGALLLHHGELSVKDIRAIPLFTHPDQIDAAVEYLIRTFNAEVYTKRVASSPIPEWEEVIRLKTRGKISLASYEKKTN
jgi:hypothetical protein